MIISNHLIISNYHIYHILRPIFPSDNLKFACNVIMHSFRGTNLEWREAIMPACDVVARRNMWLQLK